MRIRYVSQRILDKIIKSYFLEVDSRAVRRDLRGLIQLVACILVTLETVKSVKSVVSRNA